MEEKLNHGIVMKALDFCYDKAVNGLPGTKTAEELANSYLNKGKTLEKAAKKLVRYQIAKASTSGFMTGLGGLLTLPVTVPTDMSVVLYIQIRMIAAVAAMGRHDVRADQVKTIVYACLCGSAVGDLVRDMGIQVGTKLSTSAINKISGATFTKINQAVGFRLLTKFGQTGVINLGKAIPFVGGVIGGTFDGVSTKVVGKIAIKTFLSA